jgi:glycosyltransferase involved in cell wall biosynthesis
VARLVDPKGLDTLLRACALLRQRGLDFQCRLIGGLEEPIYTYSWIELRRLRTNLGLEPWVELEGSRGWSDIQAAYAWADLLALPAHVDRYGAHDVTPNCIFEAMAAQLPVLACAVGGIAEQVEHGRSAWLVEPDQPEALARALEHLWGDADLRSRLAQQALKRCQSLFEGRRQAEEWLHFLT